MVTMADIARHAGVSRPTVSLVLGDHQHGLLIADETRRRVLETAETLGYRRNEAARTTAQGKSRMIGFLTALPGAEQSAVLLSGILGEAQSRGFTVHTMAVPSHRLDRRVIESCVELRLAGVIALYITGENLNYLHDQLQRFKIPLAILDDNTVQSWGAPIHSDYGQGMALALEHLRALGHRDIGFIGAHQPDSTFEIGSQIRETAFRAAMKDAGLLIRENWMVPVAFDPEFEANIAAFLRRAPLPTAVIGATDVAAFKTMRQARAAELRVPADLSVVGYGNLAMSPFSDPALTTVWQRFEQMGVEAVRYLLDPNAQFGAATGQSAPTGDAEFPGATPRPMLVSNDLIVRHSTASPRPQPAR